MSISLSLLPLTPRNAEEPSDESRHRGATKTVNLRGRPCSSGHASSTTTTRTRSVVCQAHLSRRQTCEQRGSAEAAERGSVRADTCHHDIQCARRRSTQRLGWFTGEVTPSRCSPSSGQEHRARVKSAHVLFVIDHRRQLAAVRIALREHATLWSYALDRSCCGGRRRPYGRQVRMQQALLEVWRSRPRCPL